MGIGGLVLRDHFHSGSFLLVSIIIDDVADHGGSELFYFTFLVLLMPRSGRRVSCSFALLYTI